MYKLLQFIYFKVVLYGIVKVGNNEKNNVITSVNRDDNADVFLLQYITHLHC